MLARGIACTRSTCRVTGEAPRNRPSLRQRSCGRWTRRSKPNGKRSRCSAGRSGDSSLSPGHWRGPSASHASSSSARRRGSWRARAGTARCRRQTLTRFGDELHVSWRATVLRFLALQMRGSEHGHAALAALRRELFARGEPSRPVLRDALAVLAATDLRADVVRIPVAGAGDRRRPGHARACGGGPLARRRHARGTLRCDRGRGARAVSLPSRRIRARGHEVSR